jgi:hypothetical protein
MSKTNRTIWRTVVFAGAMLGCGGPAPAPAQTTPSNTTLPPPADTTGTAKPAQDPAMTPTTTATTPTSPTTTPGAADPCAGGEVTPQQATEPPKPRPRSEPVARPKGRGFVLA